MTTHTGRTDAPREAWLTSAPAPTESLASASRAILRHERAGAVGAPLVVVLGGISAHAHVAATAADPTPGWWDAQVGAGRSIDTDRYQVLAVDWLGESGAGSGAPVTTHDQADALAHLLDVLGIETVQTVVGASYGGMVALAFGERYGERTRQLVVFSAAHESTPMSTGLRALQRRIVTLGIESGRAGEALAIARALAMTTYRSADEFAARFSPVMPDESTDGVHFEVERYLMHHGTTFAARFDPHRYLALLLSADLHRVVPERITTPTVLVAAEGDTLVPRAQLESLAARLGGPSRLTTITTQVGHDAFLAEPTQVGRILTAALPQEDNR